MGAGAVRSNGSRTIHVGPGTIGAVSAFDAGNHRGVVAGLGMCYCMYMV